MVSLVVLHLSIAAVLRANGLPRQLSLMVGGLMTYLGAAAQDFIFAVQVSVLLSLAAGVFGAAIVLRWGPSNKAVVGAASCLLASAVLESGMALGAITFAGVLAVIKWRTRAVWVLAPALVVLTWWYTTADLGQKYPAPIADRFGSRRVWRCILLVRCSAKVR